MKCPNCQEPLSVSRETSLIKDLNCPKCLIFIASDKQNNINFSKDRNTHLRCPFVEFSTSSIENALNIFKKIKNLKGFI